MSDRHMFFFLIYKIGDYSLNIRCILRNFFNNQVDKVSGKQRFKEKGCFNNITLVLENMSDGHIGKLENRKKYITSLILRVFLEIHSYWKEKSFDITTNTIPI